jgi:hypothetical protein
MRRSEPRMNPSISFVEHLNGLPAQGLSSVVKGMALYSVGGYLLPSTRPGVGIFSARPLHSPYH